MIAHHVRRRSEVHFARLLHVIEQEDALPRHLYLIENRHGVGFIETRGEGAVGGRHSVFFERLSHPQTDAIRGRRHRRRRGVAPEVHVHATIAGVGRELGVRDADAAQLALECVRAARDDRDLRDIALGLRARQTRQMLVVVIWTAKQAI